jgi:RAS, dexamethasone-induced Ras-related protein 1
MSFISSGRRAGDLFVLVYSVDSRESFEEVLRLRDQIIETKCHLSGTGGASSAAANTRNLVIGTKKANTPRPVPMVIAGNKCDKDMKYVSGYIFCLDCSN